jgi:hypothetical protein
MGLRFAKVHLTFTISLSAYRCYPADYYFQVQLGVAGRVPPSAGCLILAGRAARGGRCGTGTPGQFAGWERVVSWPTLHHRNLSVRCLVAAFGFISFAPQCQAKSSPRLTSDCAITPG